ncbi:inactive pancreatic lipase-related protein 1-like [Mytilus trossulus]|uniref:inactive pancreatic lipase-related protein 1-like n=1 Tax=Mytilus trossulus TaxID=6551 RepID=UPI003007B6F1
MASLLLAPGLTVLLLTVALEAFFLGKSKVCYKDLDCFTKDEPFTNSFGTLPESPDELQIKLLVFTRNNKLDGRAVVYNDPQSVQQSGYDSTKPLKVLIHGYMSQGDADWVIHMKDALLQKGDFNVMTVDWRIGARKIYNQATANTRLVGAVIARMLNVLKDDFGCDTNTIHLIGHSLGAQTAGYIGQRVPGLGRISGMDPAGPLFENYSEDVKLDPSDAKFVDVIHSDAVPLTQTGFGTSKPCGHIDFFPNSGHHQPGCPPPYKATAEELLTLHFSVAFNELACSHQRAYYYFTESILDTCKFTAVPCTSDTAYAAGQCSSCGDGPCPVMGFDSDKTQQRGTFYLKTNSQTPFCVSSN